MATPGISAPTTGRVKLSDDFLEANRGDAGIVIDLYQLTPQEAFVHGGSNCRARVQMGKFRPTGLLIDGDRDGGGGQEEPSVDLTATAGQINGVLFDENPSEPVSENYATHVVHPVRYRYILPYGTTARGIKFHSAG
jgi:hypothetical protein